MIFYIFNNYFPDNSGFTIRCTREIDALSKIDDVIVICRKRNEDEKESTYKSPYRDIQIKRYSIWSNLTERPKLYIPFLYETIRNVQLCIGMSWVIGKAIYQNRQKKGKIYAISSPLTVPLTAKILGVIFNIQTDVLEFHDLEPELAQHIKGINKNSIIYKIELLLERYLCRSYNKVIVTSASQAERIIQRTNIYSNKIHVLPNTVNKISVKNVSPLQKMYGLSKNDYVVACFSSFTFDYTVTGFIKIIDAFNKATYLDKVKLLVVGEGDELQKLINHAKCNTNIIFTGKVSGLDTILPLIDAGIIPWEKDAMTETILPTKLFDYMSAKKTIFAPNFGEFKRVLKRDNSSILYSSINNLLHSIAKLSNDKKRNMYLQKNAFEIYTKFYDPRLVESKLLDIISI